MRVETAFLCNPSCPRTCSVEQTGLELLPLPPECWNQRTVPPLHSSSSVPTTSHLEYHLVIPLPRGISFFFDTWSLPYLSQMCTSLYHCSEMVSCNPVWAQISDPLASTFQVVVLKAHNITSTSLFVCKYVYVPCACLEEDTGALGTVVVSGKTASTLDCRVISSVFCFAFWDSLVEKPWLTPNLQCFSCHYLPNT